MDLTTLEAISPVDGRYRKAVSNLADYFSEGALIKYRVRVEIEYFIALCKIPLPQLKSVTLKKAESLRSIYENFSISDALKVKQIEESTNHDIKAVEYYLRHAFENAGLGDYKEFIHFGLTSQDINNTALPLTLKEAWINEFEPCLQTLAENLAAKAQLWKKVAMLARTHGQPASPTRLGKELYVFVNRLSVQYALLKTIPYSAKFGGATGNLNAHVVAYPEVDWIEFAEQLVNEILGLERSRVTTQIENYDNLAAFCDGMKRINTILIDLCRDLWAYISMDYFKQKIKKGEVGSSTMPHKVNPIDFENAEGNLGVANALFEHLAAKLPISRLQRDLTDSTVTRNLGVPIAHTLIAFKSILRGLDKLVLNEQAIGNDLENNWAVVAEAIQTILRKEGYPEPYEALKSLTRTHGSINAHVIEKFIRTLDVSDEVKSQLLKIRPGNYTGIADF
ncbi:MAG: adenylosuccinate lyase [Desulfobacteraceae bacterium]|nr:adenylosuccinate lyase [Desulfobacteraceae bacterium]